MNKKDSPKQLRVDSIEAWENWLRDHHEKEEVAWLVFKKKSALKGTAATGKGAPQDVPFDYHMALDVALCYGWVDSLLKRIDEKEYMRKFTPRKATSTWSEINKKKVEELIREGRMQPAGLRAIEAGKASGMWDRGLKRPEVDDSLPGALIHALQAYPKARVHYFALKANHQKQYNIWINMAKRPETVHKRVNEAIALLEEGKQLGLK